MDLRPYQKGRHPRRRPLRTAPIFAAVLAIESDQAGGQAVRVTNRANLPAHLASVIEGAWRNDLYDGPKGPTTRTVTQLIGPAQKFQLERDHETDLELDVLDMVPALEGSAIHHLLDRAGQSAPELIPERRLQVMHDGWTISGKADVFVTQDQILVDYKRGSVWSYIYTKPEWEAQLNVYAWLSARNGFPVRSLEIDLFCGDWRRSEARKMEDYPTRVVAIPTRLWTLDEQTAYVDKRLALHRSTLPPCSPEERWAKPDSWAIKKDGNKKARAVYKKEAEAARDLRPGELIEYRPGESTRCASWCLAAPFCNQWAKDPTNPKNTPGEV
jgi:hypothetical protein